MKSIVFNSNNILFSMLGNLRVGSSIMSQSHDVLHMSQNTTTDTWS